MHLRADQVEALLECEASSSSEALRRHLQSCAACAALLAQARAADRHDAELLQALDHPLPVVTVDALIARARRPSPRRRTVRASVAASLLLAASVAAAAVPGSPIRRLVTDALVRAPQPAVPAAPAMAGPRAGSPPPQEPNGIAFVPGSAVEVVFRNAQAGGTLHVRLDTAATLRITDRGPAAAAAAFTLADDGVTVENPPGDGSFDVSIPRGIAHVRVRIGRRAVFAKEGARIRAAVARDRNGWYSIPFAPTAPGRAP